MSRRRPARVVLARLFLVSLVVLGVGACQVRTNIGIDVKSDGSGTVTVSIGLDDAANKAIGGLGAVLRTDDLTKAGWTVSAPTKDPDGFTSVRLSKPFANPSEANTVFAEISGKTGPFRDFHLSRSRTFARTDTTFAGTVDFTGGLNAFADSALADQLNGKPLGQDLPTIEKRIGAPLDQVFTFRVSVRLPGDVSSNAVAKADNGAVWQPKLSDTSPSRLAAKGESWRVGTIASTAVGIVALLAAAVVLVRRMLGRRRTEVAGQ